MKQKTIMTIVFTGLASLALGWFIGFSLGFAQGEITNINSYDECVAAGYPVQESYPEQCSVPGGESYSNSNATPSVEVIGKVICLQHKNPDQPHTLECAAGIESENGETYALKAGSSDIAGLAGSETRVKIQGKLSSTGSDVYQTTGELTVESYTTAQ